VSARGPVNGDETRDEGSGEPTAGPGAFEREWAEAADRGGPPPARRRRRPWIALAVVLVLVVGTALFGAWLLTTPSGTGWAAQQAQARVPGLRIGGVQGTLWHRLVVHAIRYAPPEGGTSAEIRRVTVSVAWPDLLRGAVHVTGAEVLDARIHLAPAPPKPEEKPFSLEPPIDVLVDRFVVLNAFVERDGTRLATIRTASARGRWTGAGLAIDELDVRADEGALQMQARIAGGPVYDVAADGRFRWRVGTLEWQGGLRARSRGPRLDANFELEAPLRAHVDAGVRQSDDWPWTLALRVPTFDPRRLLGPDGAIESASATLRGSGTRERAALHGSLTANGQPIELEELLARREPAGAVVLERLAIRPFASPGRIDASGRLDADAEPLRGQLTARWGEIVVPAALAGQVLRTRGRIEAAGGPAAWRASGTLEAGPGPKLATVAFLARGVPERIDLERFDVVQRTGRLAARGVVRLRPRLGWDLDANARSFDPGEFAAAWPGDLDFTVATEGALEEGGPRGRVLVRELGGRLRGRPIDGRADLSFDLPERLAGSAQLRSGGSRVTLEGRRGTELDAQATFSIASLDDFVPYAAGRFDGTARARGAWPDVRVELRANGRGLRAFGTTVAALDAGVDVRRPKAPEGTLRLTARSLKAGGLEFGTLEFDAAGNAAQHRASLSASGPRLAVDTAVTGALTLPEAPKPSRGGLSAPAAGSGIAWRGAVERLELRAPDVARFALVAPARVEYVDGAVSVRRSCLADGDASLCAALEMQPDGRLATEYAISRLPLGLANGLLPGQLPGELSGEVGGEGRMRRDAAGRWYGEATLASAEAAIVWSDDVAAAGERLVLYRDLRLAATLRGTAADARATGAIGGDGSLDARGSVADIDSAAPRIDATLRADVRTLAPFAPFVPQVDALDGRVTANATVRGTTARPQVAGTVRAERVVAEIPLLGLRLQDGRMDVDAQPGADVRFSGSLRSGEGTLKLDGTATTGGRVVATIAGENVVAADLPAARVIAAPDLRVERDPERIDLTGRVAIPVATINVQRLPQAGPQKVSPDVVVVDRAPDVEEAKQPLQLYARVEVALGEKVELGGFGLQSTLTGQLAVIERPGRRTSGSGEIRIAGQYKAYGQDLTITDGRLLYAGTPLDNPRLEITAVRELDDDLQAGLRIRGTARNPEVSVFSDPSLGETDALAYLVTGRPMNAIGRGTGEQGDMVQKAAQSLGTAAGGLLAKRLGKRLGIDEVGISDSEEIGGAAFTVGQYLSPRLYLGYGIGLFDPGQVITLRYALSDDLSVEAVRGDETTRAGVEYRVER
jgi:translocation and assembly module TamB